jgi:outer membrane protein TolC
MKNYSKILQFLLLLFFACIYGQKSLTFENCLDIAFENNLSVKNAKISEKIATYQLTNSKTKILPSVNASVSNNYSWGRGIDPNTNSYINQQFKSYNGSLGSNLTLFNGFSNITAIKTAKQELELNKTTVQKIKNEITIDVASKFTTILYLQDVIKSNQEQLTSTQKQLGLITTKFEQGYVAESEVFKVKSQKASEELTLINNQNLLSTNILDLKQLLNIALDEDIVLVAPTERLFSKLDLALNDSETITEAVHKNPNYLISKINQQKSKLNISSSRSSILS